tara:strand:- start:493 stop:813 length:321 start_codon:yes stop_codon:yes gene_type:complete
MYIFCEAGKDPQVISTLELKSGMKGPFAFLAMETQFRVRFQMNTPDGITSGQKYKLCALCQCHQRLSITGHLHHPYASMNWIRFKGSLRGRKTCPAESQPLAGAPW